MNNSFFSMIDLGETITLHTEKARVSQLTTIRARAGMEANHEELNQLLVKLLRVQMGTMGMGSVIPAYRRWLDESHSLLEQHRHLSADGAWAEWNLKKSMWPELPIQLAETALRALPEILTGRVAAADVIADTQNRVLDSILLFLQDPFAPVRKVTLTQDFLAGGDAGQYDIAIAADSLSRNAIREAKAALRKDGLLVVRAVSSGDLLSHLTYGLLPDSTVQEAGSLQKALAKEGFETVHFPLQQVLIAASDGTVRQKQQQQKAATVRQNAPAAVAKAQPKAQAQAPSGEGLKERSIAYFTQLIGDTLKIPSDKIDPREQLEVYGIDSVIIVQLTNALRKVMDNVSSTLFFEYRTINDLVDYFISNRSETLTRLVGVEAEVPVQQEEVLPPPVNQPVKRAPRLKRTQEPERQRPQNSPFRMQDVAIIGLAGRYAGACDVNEFWRNLKSGLNCITEVPADRWDWKTHFHEQKGNKGTTYSRWGGFVNDIDKFDPLFFKLSPRDAEYMDPQERLFLEVAYECMQDAGYTPSTISDSRKVGVFAGVMNGIYPIGANYFSITNRVSYLFDFQGPSLAVDTACSASLTAIHLALESLYSGTSDCAIAGGVNLILDPVHLVKLSQLRMLSSSDQLKAFGDHADGFVDGEGVGAVVLKPLEKAIADNDHIYGIIKGSMINAGGKTNGYSVPNPDAQARVVADSLQRAGIDARAVSYVEAHGTGTSLGDPIEIAGLMKAFGTYTQDKQFCAIGSAKANIGHCESAAGIAGVTKVLMQLKHGQIAPSIHSAVLNPNIDFPNTPFAVPQQLSEWKRPVLEQDGMRREYPRIAGISSFGAGGSNAHLIIEEYMPQEERPHWTFDRHQPALIVLSAKNRDRLHELVKRFVDAIREGQWTDEDLADVAYTLQVGREAMEERLALTCASIREMEEKLTAFLSGNEMIAGLFAGQAKRGPFSEEWGGHGMGQHAEVLDNWVKGSSFDWNKLYGDRVPRRISLPTYPFARERYWVRPEDELIRSAITPSVTPTVLPSGREQAVLVKEWKASGMQPTGAAPAGAVIVLQTAETSHLASALFVGRQDLHVVHASANLYSAQAGELLYEQVRGQVGGRKLLGVIDITAYDRLHEQSTAVEEGKITFLQACIARDRREGLTLLQVTNNLQAWQTSVPTLQGARTIGLYRMLGSEYKQIRSVTMDSDCLLSDRALLAAQIETEFLGAGQWDLSECCYRNGQRFVPQLVMTPVTSASQTYASDDVVLITGGTRGIGAAVAENAVVQGCRRLVLMGREDLASASQDKRQRLQKLADQGVQVLYYNTPLTDANALRSMVEDIHRKAGRITGVFHCAGTVGKNPAFFEKTADEIRTVCEPKMAGLAALHEVLNQEPLAFFVLFSSVASASPVLAAGQSDYGMANAYMDYYAAAQAAQGRRYFKSIQWPAWGEVGMAAGQNATPAYTKTGLVPITTAEGLSFLDRLIRSSSTVSLPFVSDEEPTGFEIMLQTRHQAAPQTLPVAPVTVTEQPRTSKQEDASPEIRQWLRDIFIAELRLSPEQLEEDKPFDEYGLDSIVLAQVVHSLEKRVDTKMSPSLLLEYTTIAELTDYFNAHHAGAFTSQSEVTAPATATAQATATAIVPAPVPVPVPAPVPEPVQVAVTPSSPVPRAPAAVPGDEIAIVGLACRMPGAPNKEAYWKLLTNGDSAIRPVAADRWTTRGDRVDYGGWMDDVDRFDPAFFNIQDADAAIMDPQARIILEESLAAIYDAGYEHKELSGAKVGVYIGGRSQPNRDTVSVFAAPNPILGTGQNYLATNISRFFNFRGPSMVVDTACSSGLAGMSIASDALLCGRIDMALVGAVSVLHTPDAHDLFAARNILNREGKFDIFDKDSSGEVLGEGAGVVVLKRLRDAVRDGDQIYSVIRSIASNNDGRTLGPGSPNMAAQKQVILEALAEAGKRPEDVGYIEINGGGSPVVDVIEIKALSEAYQLDNPTLPSCPVGSVKPNVGHLLSASAMAGFIRCVLSVSRAQIPPFLSAHRPFDHYDFASSRIEFNRETTSWKTDPGKTRVAALSSFPDGGTNFHVLLEEFVTNGTYRQRKQPLAAPQLARKSFPLKQANRETVREPALSIQNVWGSYHGKSL